MQGRHATSALLGSTHSFDLDLGRRFFTELSAVAAACRLKEFKHTRSVKGPSTFFFSRSPTHSLSFETSNNNLLPVVCRLIGRWSCLLVLSSSDESTRFALSLVLLFHQNKSKKKPNNKLPTLVGSTDAELSERAQKVAPNTRHVRRFLYL